MSEWKEYKLEEIIEVFIDYRGKTPQKSSFGIPLITAKVVKEGRILPPNEFIPEADYDSWMTRGLPEINDVVLTTEAPLGEVALIKDNRVALAQRIITMRGKRDIVDNIFLKYYFQSKQGQYELSSRASGTTVFGIKAEVLKKVPVFLPPLIEQRRIAAILSSLDDKIDLLHRENATLEQMAETLFGQWFVVEAKEEWEEGKLGDIVDVKSGFAFKSSSFVDFGLYRLITIKAVQDGFLTLENADYISEIPDNIKDYCLLKEGDILLSLTGNVGRCCLVDRERLLLNQRVALLCAKDNKNWAFVYTLFGMQSMKSKLEEMAKGTAQPNLSPIELSNMQFEIPPTKLLEGFSDAATPLLKKALSNNKQIQALIETRDGLLPKLMSNEIKI